MSMRELRIWRKEKPVVSRVDSHLDTVVRCVSALIEAIPEIAAGDKRRTADARSEVFRLERDADLIARDLEQRLSRRSLNRVDREDLIRLVFHFEAIADHAEAAADELHRVSFERMEQPIKARFLVFVDLVGQTASKLHETGRQFENSNEAVVGLGDEVSQLENHTDEERRRLMDVISSEPPSLSLPEFFSFNRLISALENIADSCEDAANTLRIIAIARK